MSLNRIRSPLSPHRVSVQGTPGPGPQGKETREAKRKPGESSAVQGLPAPSGLSGPQLQQYSLAGHKSPLRSSHRRSPGRRTRGGPRGRRVVIGRPGARPLMPERREGAGPAACSAPRLRAPIDPEAAAPRLSSVCGGRCGSAEWRWRTGVSFRSCRRHLRVCEAGGGEGTRGCSWNGLLSGDSPSFALLFLLRAPPPPAPCALPAQSGSKRVEEGTAGGGRGRRADERSEETPARPVRPRARGVPRPGLGSGRKGLSRGGRGRCRGGGPAVPALSCRARLLPT